MQNQPENRLNSQTGNHQKSNHKRPLIVAGIICLLIAVPIIITKISMKKEEARKYPYQEQLNQIFEDNSYQDMGGSPIINGAYTVYLRDNNGHWVYYGSTSKASEGTNQDEGNWADKDLPGSVRDYSQARTIVLLWIDATDYKKVNNYKWDGGGVAYETPLNMDVIDLQTGKRHETVVLTKVLLNSQKDGMYKNYPRDVETGNILDVYGYLKKYIH